MSDEDDEYKNKGKLFNFFMELTKNESIADLENFGIGIVAVSLTCVVLYMASKDPKAMTDKFYMYFIFGILPAMIGVFLAAKLFSGPTDINKLYFYGGTLFVFIIIVILINIMISFNMMAFVMIMIFIIMNNNIFINSMIMFITIMMIMMICMMTVLHKMKITIHA